MDVQILKLDAPFDYIYCNGEAGKHIATYIVGETTVDENGNYNLQTHSHPIVQYMESPQGVVWNRAELRDCEVLCNEKDMRVDVGKFFLLCVQRVECMDSSGMFIDYDPGNEARWFKEKLQNYGIGFKAKKKVREIGVEIGHCSEGYFAQLMDTDILYFHHVEPTLEKLVEQLKSEREYWEDFYDHVVKIKYTPESSLATEVIEKYFQ